MDLHSQHFLFLTLLGSIFTSIPYQFLHTLGDTIVFYIAGNVTQHL